VLSRAHISGGAMCQALPGWLVDHRQGGLYKRIPSWPITKFFDLKAEIGV
jgi:hypothetical protein